MANASWDEASKCPRCETQGVKVAEHKAPGQAGRRGAMIKTLQCPAVTCPARDMERNKPDGFGLTWLVQVERDGSIPIKEAGEKQYQLPGWAAQQAAREIEEAKLVGRHADAGEIKTHR
jgi:hypothetical protein